MAHRHRPVRTAAESFLRAAIKLAALRVSQLQ
jgi:hypothetical protein